VLRTALTHYEQLVGSSGESGKNKDGKLPGVVIRDRYYKGTLPYTYIGKKGGLPALDLDMATDVWETTKYEVALGEPASTKNWFPVEEFIERANRTLYFITKTVPGDYPNLRMRRAVFTGPDNVAKAGNFAGWCRNVGGAADIQVDYWPMIEYGPQTETPAIVYYVMQPGLDLASVVNALTVFGAAPESAEEITAFP
jgi:hypothetical protein